MTETVISVVLTRTPGKTIEVAGGESLSGEVLNLGQLRSHPTPVEGDSSLK